MPSNRKELIYEVQRVPQERDLKRAVIAHWEEVSPSYGDQDQCLVFCRTLDNAKSLGLALNVPPYHRECPDDSPVRKFLAGENKILPTTLKLGCGFHYSHIQDILHMDLTYSVVDQYQEDSQGGRDGKPCHAITFVLFQARKVTMNKVEDIHIPPTSHDFPISQKKSKFVAMLIM